MHIRQIMTDVSIMKQDACRIDKAFGGINVLFVCAFHPLDPPSGAPINALPASFVCNACKYAPGATTNTANIFSGVMAPGPFAESPNSQLANDTTRQTNGCCRCRISFAEMNYHLIRMLSYTVVQLKNLAPGYTGRQHVEMLHVQAKPWRYQRIMISNARNAKRKENCANF